MASTSDMLSTLQSLGYLVDQSFSGYYRLLHRRDDGTLQLVIDDPAEGDYYSEDLAIELFYNHVLGL